MLSVLNHSVQETCGMEYVALFLYYCFVLQDMAKRKNWKRCAAPDSSRFLNGSVIMVPSAPLTGCGTKDGGGRGGKNGNYHAAHGTGEGGKR
jgi:hypothetical protein